MLRRYLGLPLLTVYGLFILFVAVSYLRPQFNHGFLQGREDFFYGRYQFALLTHGISASVAILMAGWMMLLKKGGKGHQFFGKIYVFLVLFLATPSAAYISMFAIGGWSSTLAFLLLAIAWFLSTCLAVRGKNHGYWIRMSFLLACSAYILRTLLMLAPLFSMEFEQYYRLTAWMCWAPWLLIYLFSNRKKVSLRFS